MTFGVVGSGTRVSVIQPRSNARRLGLRPGDVIASVNGRNVSRATELTDALKGLRPGDRLAIVVGRAGGRAEVRGPFQPDPVSGPDAVPAITMFPRSQPSGRVDLVRVGNTVTSRTRGVAAFTLLLSPDAFDFSQPVRVVANGRVGLRRACRAESADAVEMGRARQRSDDAVRRRAAGEGQLVLRAGWHLGHQYVMRASGSVFFPSIDVPHFRHACPPRP